MKQPQILQVLQEKFSGQIVKSNMEVLDPFVVVAPQAIADICAYLKEDDAFAWNTSGRRLPIGLLRS